MLRTLEIVTHIRISDYRSPCSCVFTPLIESLLCLQAVSQTFHGWVMESYNNTNHATVAVVDDLLHGILEFQLALFSDGSNFRGDAVIHQLFHSLAEDISLPDTPDR